MPVDLLGNTDIYLIDQMILKGRYRQHDRILDAGCGHSRNLRWFLLRSMSTLVLQKQVRHGGQD